MTEAAKVIGRAIDKDVGYVQVSYKEHTKALVRAGMSLSAANTLTEMCRHLNDGTVTPIEKRSKENITQTSIEQFAQKFAVVYNNN